MHALVPRTLALSLSLAALGACVPRVTHVAPPAGTVDWVVQPPPYAIPPETPRDDSAAIAAAVRDAVATVTSPLFRLRLASVGPLCGGFARPRVAGADLARSLLSLAREPAPLPTTYTPAPPSGCPGASALTTAVTAVHPSCPGSLAAPPCATTCLSRLALARMRLPTLAARACSVNTVAHEWVHAIPLRPRAAASRYTDGGHALATEPLASYTVGALAQCAFLALHDALRAEHFDDCVARVGTTRFDPHSCDPAWLERRGWTRPAR